VEVVLRLASWIAALLVALATYRSARRRDSSLGHLVAAAILVRAILGVALFAASVFEWPLLPHLQMGGGFWSLAIDARWYFDHSAAAAHQGLQIVEETAPSPLFLRSLAVFMRAAGVSPAAAILFNLLCFLALVRLVLFFARKPKHALVTLAPFAFAPGLLIFGTQPLKDPFNLALLVLACAGARGWTEGLGAFASGRVTPLLAGAAVTAMAVYALGGVRPYLAVFIIIGAGGAGTITAYATAGAVARTRIAAGTAATVLALWIAFAYGAGAYFGYYDGLLKSLAGKPSAPMTSLEQARSGFVASGGATSFASEPAVSDGGVVTTSPGSRLSRAVVGLAVMFVPITLLKALSLVAVGGGKGLLLVTDIDTIVMDLLTLLCVAVFFRDRSRASVGTAAALLIVALLTTIAMAYVVTNFGTMFRLRPIALAPLWLLPALALTRPDVSERLVITPTPR
jgi:hypothetical protein